MNNADKEDGKSIEAGSPPIFPPTLLPTDEDVARELVDHICKAGIWGITGAAAIIARHTAGLRAERDALARWKEEAMTVESWWKEIDTFIRKHPKCPLGHSVPAIALGWLRDRDSLRAEVERLTKKGQADAHDFSVAMNKRHEINWAEISSLRAALNASEERVKKLEAAKPEYWLPKSITVSDIAAKALYLEADLTDARAKIAALQNELLNAKDTK